MLIHSWVKERLKKNPYLAVFGFILLLGLFFRAYKVIDWFEFAHDGGRYSWIVKDIVVDKHIRLIGQMTTAHGIFIGPLFYYLLIPFFFLTKMDPVGAVIPITIIGVLTVASYYYVFSRLFGKEVGLIASFLYAVFLSPVFFDRRVVPSTPTNLWLVWYFYVVVSILRGRYQVLPILGLLAGLIWHIHIALLPTLAVIPAAVVLSKKIPNIKQVILSLAAFLIPFSPFLFFETRHNFSQTAAFIRDFTVNHGGGTGFDKLNLVIIKIASNINKLFFYPQDLKFINHTLFAIFVLSLGIILVKKKLLSLAELLVFYFWIGTIILFYTFSSSPISEYYFANIEIIFLAIASMALYLLYKFFPFGKYLVVALLAFVFLKNISFLLTTQIYKKGYNERKAVVLYIKEDSYKKGLPCVSVSYITTPGENVGFRYFFWLNNLHITQIREDSATYSIVIPRELAWGANEKDFGQIKVIPPERIPNKESLAKSCSGQNTNLTDPMFGFTN